MGREGIYLAEGTICIIHKTRGLNLAARGGGDGGMGDNLSKHLGDLGVCTPFSGATESLELCNEPN